MSTVDLFQDRKSPREQELRDWDLFLVGSDQVWRAKYCKIEDYFFKFLDSDSRPKVAYAASFGVNPRLEYSPNQLKEASACLMNFKAISVRESTGVSILKNDFNVPGVQVLDPTLLWPAKFYNDFLNQNFLLETSGTILSLFLDETDSTESISLNYSQETGKKITKLYSKKPKNLAEFLSKPKTFILPSPADWLSAIKHADLVLTDSFHATVFSIIFGVDFLVVPNESRGMDRIHSLLGDLGLSERVLTSGFLPLTSVSKINWSLVEKNITRKRVKSWEFLEYSLRGN